MGSATSKLPDFDQEEFRATLFRLQSMPEFSQPDGAISFCQMTPVGRFVSNRALEVVHDSDNELDKEIFVSRIQDKFGLSRGRAIDWYYRYRNLINRYRPAKI